jgi:hypothetical protein
MTRRLGAKFLTHARGAAVTSSVLAAMWIVPATASAATEYAQPSLAPSSPSLTSVHPLIEGYYYECQTSYSPGTTCYGASGPVRSVEPYAENGQDMCVGASSAGEKCGGEAFYVGSGEHEPFIRDVSGSGGAEMLVHYA